MSAIGLIEQELDSYLNGTVTIAEGHDYSQYKLVKRIHLYANQVYPKGKTDKRGNYKYWFDIIGPRVDSEVKNIDFDTKDILLYSERKKDDIPILIANLRLKEWLKEEGQSEEINEAVEEASGWGNVVWKKTKDGYERVDLKNFYVINQTAEDLDDSTVIERHILTQTDLREKKGVWKNVDEVIKNCASYENASFKDASPNDSATPYYEVFERNGEISLADLKDAQGKKASLSDEDKYVYAKLVVAGTNQNGKYSIKNVLYADEISAHPYKEFHRGRYYGRWWRQGLIEILFDCQTRANEIGNQIARGLEYASKAIFYSPDQRAVQNVLTDLSNGDMLRASQIHQVEVRMQGFDQLIADWNRNLAHANELANSREVVQGENLPAGTPFRLGAMLNVNANKLFDFLREKLAICYTDLLQDWVLPRLVKDLKAADVVRLTGDSQMLERFLQVVIDDWYIKNLVAIGPHDQSMQQQIKASKMEELKKRPLFLAKLTKEMFKDFVPKVQVIITGEQANLNTDLETLATFANMEIDPIRRQALIELAMRKKGIDVAGLPKSSPQALSPVKEPVGALSASEKQA